MTLRVDPGRWEQYGRGGYIRSGIYEPAEDGAGRPVRADVMTLDAESWREWLAVPGNADRLANAIRDFPMRRP